MKLTICPQCGGSLESLAIGWRCKKCKGFISYQDGKFYEYVEKPFLPPMTNADRIRAMSDEELAEAFAGKCLCDYIPVHATEHCDRYRKCKDCVIEWLKQPVED